MAPSTRSTEGTDLTCGKKGSNSTGVNTFSPTLTQVTDSTVGAAKAWVSARIANGNSGMGEGGVAAFGLANQAAPGSSSRVFLVCDGEPNCPGPVAEYATITQANFLSLPLHVVYLGISPGVAASLQVLADQNGGTFLQP